MSPEANQALERLKVDYPALQWAQDMPNTVLLWFESSKAFVHLVGEELDPPIELDEARVRSALDAILGVTTVTPDDELDLPPDEDPPLTDEQLAALAARGPGGIVPLESQPSIEVTPGGVPPVEGQQADVTSDGPAAAPVDDPPPPPAPEDAPSSEMPPADAEAPADAPPPPAEG